MMIKIPKTRSTQIDLHFKKPFSSGQTLRFSPIFVTIIAIKITIISYSKTNDNIKLLLSIKFSHKS